MGTNLNTIDTVPAGDALLGRVINAGGEPSDGRGPLTPAARLPIDRPLGAEAGSARQAEILESGIKAIDLYAPITRGGTIAMSSGSGVGKLAATTELIEHVATRRGGCAVCVLLDDPSYGQAEIVADLRSGGVEQHVAAIFAQADDLPEPKQRALLMGLALAEDFCARGRETLLVLNATLAPAEALPQLLAHGRGNTHAALTLLLWLREASDSEAAASALDSLSKYCDANIFFSRALAKQSIWPAIDPLASTSRLLDERVVGAEHVRVAREAQALLRDYGDIEGTGAAGDDPQLRGRARKALLFQGQPFVVAETFTGVPGEYVSVEETVRGFGAIVAGRHDDTPEEAFRFTGTLSQALARAAG